MATIFRREVPSIKIKFCTNWNSVTSGTPVNYWPGSQYVDIISMDIYEALHGNWATVKSGGDYDLDWLVTFAQQQGVKIALSEWGAANDDGGFITGAAQWMNSLGSLFDYHVYSQYEPADQVVNPGDNPNDQAAWIAAWRNTRYGISTPPPTLDPPVGMPVADVPVPSPVASSLNYLSWFVTLHHVICRTDSTLAVPTRTRIVSSCSGNDQEKCGGGFRNSVFRTNSRCIGCFIDSATRDLPFKAYDGGNNTPDKCKTLCANAGYVFVGLHWCGNSFGQQGLDLDADSACDLPCTGDASVRWRGKETTKTKFESVSPLCSHNN